ncbi:hypothetical protein L208DRAFT_1424478 [Tricholoma matsutake]|nr:hypothetical protein L208DRAFT_1424478 [Tricholoma matsutake 945]
MLTNAESYVETLENGLNIEEWWTTTSAEYQTFYQANVQTNYEQALDELEWLVVICLGTGYKLHCQLGKALQQHSEAIRNALSRYNAQAAKLMTPHPSLSWKEIVDYSFIAHREATVKFFKLCHACEEAISQLSSSDLPLAAELHQVWKL